MNKPLKKDRLKPLSFYGYKPEDVIRALMQVDPKKVKEAGKPKFRLKELDKKEE